MRIIETITDSEKVKKGCVLTIGNFDGVHIGHQEILTTAVQIAAQRSTELVVMTFEPHPVAVLHPEKAPGVLTPLGLKERLLAEFGVDCLVVLKDSAELLNLSPQGFVDEFLMKNVRPGFVVEGENFNFGYGRSGNVQTLRELAAQRGFEVIIMPAKQLLLSSGENVTASSSLIRNLLEKGRVADAGQALGRPYRLIGKTVSGKGKGRELGFPTANIEPAEQIIPAEGVYAGFVEIGRSYEQVCKAHNKLPAALSIGRAKTFITDHSLLTEAHILKGTIGDLSGKWLAMDFVEFIRHQERFESENQLAEQIAKDCQKAKRILITDCTD